MNVDKNLGRKVTTGPTEKARGMISIGLGLSGRRPSNSGGY